MRNSTQSQIESLVHSFASELATLLAQATREDLAEAFGSTTGASAPKSASSPLRRKKSATAKKSTNKAAPKAPTAKKAGKKGVRVRRSLKSVEKTAEALLREVQKKGDRRMEEIATSMGTSTKELALPMKKLLEDKKVTAKGKARGTKYSAK